MIRDPRQTAPPEAGPRALLVSSDASARLAAARQWIGSLPRDAEALLLASHGHAADEVARVDAADHGARFGLRRATLDRLAFQLAAPALARRGAAPATSLTLAAVVARAVHRLLERGSAGRFAEIAGRPGFPHAAVRTLEELRGAGIGAGNLRAALPDAADLASILEGMEREMGDLRLADRAEVILLAAAAIESGEAFPAPRPLLLLDLAPVQKVEWDLVEALVARSPRVLATAPRGDAAAIARLEAMLGVSATCPDGKEAETSLALLKRHLFEDSGPDPRDMDETVSVASWPGEARECVEIARRIQEEASAGVPFDRMAIFLRSPNSYRSHLEEALRRAAIPAHFARGALRPDPAGRALLALLACAAEGLSARRFAEYLSLGQVPDPSGAPDETWAPPEHELAPAVAGAAAPGSALGSADEGRAPDPDAGISEGGLRAPWRWERLLVDAAVIGGRDRWARRLDGLIEEIALRRKDLDGDDARAAGLERVAADLDHLRAFALPLITRLSELPAGATWAVWLERLRDLTTAALRQPHGVLGVLAELAPLGPVGPVDLVVVQHVLAPRLRDLASPPESRPEGAVFVAPIEMARGLRFDVVFVPGLAEKLFPPRILEDPLLPDEARRALGADLLATQDSRVQEHRLALRLAVGAAGLRAALSWPRVDVEMARARVPSFYGLEAIRAMEGRLPGFDELRGRAETGGSSRLGWPAPENPARAIDDTEYDLAVLGRLKDAGSDAHAGAANYLLAANPHLARALRARGRRWLKRWSYADGLVDPDPDALAALARHRMGARSFSPTALERFASCPYQFFLQAVHRIQPREESEALETIDPLTRGALFHQIQFELLTALRDRGKLPLDPGHLEEADRILEEAAGRVAEEWKEKVAPAIPRVWSDGIGAIRADLREWLRRSTEGAQGWVPHRFELSFGLADRDRPTADASSVPDPVTILDGVRLRGSVDLVERRADGALRVTDHKTGKARVDAGAVVWGGRTLQPLLYALAVEELLQGRVLSGRLYYCTSDGGFEERDIPLNEDHRAAAGVAIGVIGTALEQGFLPAAPRPDACRWCDYRPVCGPNEEVRTARKTRERLEDLERLRDMP
ncbi:MAG TPA: PD-(D/E)XK nuclease family protein [Candidatus Binatia bacterium]|nr:PD-(D/E)XK nuclease family protein [Candidatus Binatia bacterium]